jgi:hypothetical protein
MLQKGDTVDGATILHIERHRVILNRDSSNLLLTLPSY